MLTRRTTHTLSMAISPSLASRSRPSHPVDGLSTRQDWTSWMHRVEATRRTCFTKPSWKLSLLAEVDHDPCPDSGVSAKRLPSCPFQAHGTALRNASDPPMLTRDWRLRWKKRLPPHGVFLNGRSWKKSSGLKGRYGSLSEKSRPCLGDLSNGQE